MRSNKLLDGVTTNQTGLEFSLPPRPVGVDDMLCQIDIAGGTVTVTVEGRLHEDMDWQTLTSQTASTIVPLAWVPYVRAVTTSISGATVDVRIGWF